MHLTSKGQMMRHLFLASVLLTAIQAVAKQPDTPMPAVAELRARAVASFKASGKARERYLCRERIENQELDGKGQVKKTNVDEREIFYVNGYQIAQAVSKDGKPLSPGDIRKRDEAVRKAIEAASDHRKPKSDGLTIDAGDILRLAKLQNERRILVAGRPTIVFDVVPDPSAKPSGMEEKIVAAMAGTVSIDEDTGALQDVDTHGVRDVKLGGGLVANVHKGFAVHILVAPQPDGVWLIKLAEGTGDARIGLLVHSGVRFRQETLGCQLADVSTLQSGDKAHPTAAPR
jgi:hypothetical protein